MMRGSTAGHGTSEINIGKNDYIYNGSCCCGGLRSVMRRMGTEKGDSDVSKLYLPVVLLIVRSNFPKIVFHF